MSLGVCPSNHMSCHKIVLTLSPRVKLVQVRNMSTSVCERGSVIWDQGLLGGFPFEPWLA
jgi:hypothetical protein